MHNFLKPIVTELLQLERNGIEVKTPSSPYPLAGTCDLQAKCLMMNTVQFIGMFGCSKCLQPGATFHTSSRGHVHIYPYCPEDSNGPK